MEEIQYPTPRNLEEVAIAERSAIGSLVIEVENAVQSAEFNERERDGTYFLHEADEVDLVDSEGDLGTMSIGVRRDHMQGGNVYAVFDENEENWVSVVDQEDLLRHPAARAVAAGIVAVSGGAVHGAHRTAALKWLETDDRGIGMAAVRVALTRTYDGRPQPVTGVNLGFVRVHSEGQASIVQSRRIEIDPNTGEMMMGDIVDGEAFVGNEEGMPGGVAFVADPFAEIAATELQSKFRPPTPLDLPLDTSAWYRLLTEPIDRRDIVGY